jgi:hypothetical protein
MSTQHTVVQWPVSRLYFAGKIGQNDWRHKLVPRLDRAIISGGNANEDLYNPNFVLPCPPQHRQAKFIYGGPFFVGCDHGGFHGPKSHGVGILREGYSCCVGSSGPIGTGPIDKQRAKVFQVNRLRLLKADWVFAYIESGDCYGTLIELGLAYAKGIPIAMGFAPELSLSSRDDLWMAAQTAAHVFHGTAQDCWEEFTRYPLATWCDDEYAKRRKEAA